MGSRSDPKRAWNWYSLEEKGGGVIGALGTHAFDMLNWFFGESINGIPQFNSKWQTSNNDELIDVVIENSCSEFINE